jgi:hypothetical protein
MSDNLGPIFQGYDGIAHRLTCIRCLSPLNDNGDYNLCPNCRTGDALEAYFRDEEGLIAAAIAIRVGMEMDRDMMAEEGYESPMQIRSSLGL